jgi:hypothetical protein
VTGLFPSLAAVGGILLAAGAVGYAAAGAIVPRGSVCRLERLAWGFALGLLLLAGFVPICFALGVRPAWIFFLLLSGSLLAVARFFALPQPLPRLPGGGGRGVSPRLTSAPAATEGRASRSERLPGRGEGVTTVRVGLLILLSLGVLLYLLRALTEPMWATDFLAIWGWKGKTIFAAAEVPAWTREVSFAHPEYPVGLPFLYAGISFLLGRWDDHAMALLFPALQVATALLLAGWLRRRGAPRPIPLAAAAALVLFEPLYRAFTTGMAEVPLSFSLLLLGVALDDALDEEEGAWRRLAIAALGAAALKNEGLFAAGAAAAVAFAASGTPWRARRRVTAAALLPALAVASAHRLWRGPLPLRDFRFGLLFEAEFPARLALALRTIAAETLLPSAPGVIAFVLLLAVGRRSRDGDRLLALAAIPLSAYAVLPAFCVWGPDWLVRTAFARTAAALAPLAAAAAALRLAPLFRRP